MGDSKMTWELSTLENVLAKKNNWVVSLENDCLCVSNEDGLDAFVAVSGEQIIVETILFSKRQVKDVAALNDEILKTHQIFPLTTIGITTFEGEEYYVAFGSLSSGSKEESILVEVEMLFENVTGFLDAYESYLN